MNTFVVKHSGEDAIHGSRNVGHIVCYEKLAQSVEQLPFKEWVPGSIPGLLKRFSRFAETTKPEGLVPFV